MSESKRTRPVNQPFTLGGISHNTYHVFPFPEARSGVWENISAGWQDIKLVACTDTKRSTKNSSLRFDEIITQLNDRNNVYDTVYVFGHCESGSKYIMSEDQKAKLEFGELADLFGKLNTGWPGIIKLYVCKGAKNKNSLVWGESISFTQRFANEMHRREYRKCKFFSYMDAVAKGPHPHPDGKSGTHKWEPGASKPGYRSSDIRIQITGQSK